MNVLKIVVPMAIVVAGAWMMTADVAHAAERRAETATVNAQPRMALAGSADACSSECRPTRQSAPAHRSRIAIACRRRRSRTRRPRVAGRVLVQPAGAARRLLLHQSDSVRIERSA